MFYYLTRYVFIIGGVITFFRHFDFSILESLIVAMGFFYTLMQFTDE